MKNHIHAVVEIAADVVVDAVAVSHKVMNSPPMKVHKKAMSRPRVHQKKVQKVQLTAVVAAAVQAEMVLHRVRSSMKMA